MTFWQLFWVTVGSVLAFVLLILLLINGSKYSVSDAEAHSVNYANEIKEGHGGITAFLWLLFISLLLWTIIYFVIHWHEFAIIGAYAQ
jgi:hypothetical protein